MHFRILLACLALAGCAGVSSVPFDPNYKGQAATAGTSYYLPKGIVPVEVFVGEDGVAVNFDPVQLGTDNKAGKLIARTRPSIFNDEKMTVSVDKNTSFLNLISTDSTAKFGAAVLEGAQLIGRLTLQNAKLNFFKDRQQFLSDRLDPLDPRDLRRVSGNINAAIARAMRTDGAAAGDILPVIELTLDDDLPGTPPVQPFAAADLSNCHIGICARVMEVHTLNIYVDGALVRNEPIRLPSRDIVPVPVPQIILADQKIDITIESGMVTSYKVERKSEFYGLVHTVAGIPGALFQGAFGGLQDETNLDKKKTEAINAEKERKQAEHDAVTTSVNLQNAAFRGNNPYQASAVTIYPLNSSLTRAVARKRQQRAMQPQAVTLSPKQDDFVDRPTTPKPSEGK
jgi:hypothetical protein